MEHFTEAHVQGGPPGQTRLVVSLKATEHISWKFSPP